MDQLLATKFYIPKPRLELVNRPRLLTLLNEGFRSGKKLTIISAPAGFGKTTLVSEWLNKIRSTIVDDNKIIRVAWLSIDESDNDLNRFLTYFIEAVKRAEGIEPNLGQAALSMLKSSQSPPVRAILTSFINDLTGVHDNLVFILDDCQLIETPSVQEAISFFIDNLPQNTQLIIITRVDPALPLAILRAKGQLAELRAADLRFTNPEANEFLKQIMRLNITEDNIKALQARTEGWIAGLQLAALSLQGKDDIDTLIKTFAGSHRFVLDYLVEEVLQQQPKKIQTFMLQTAILNQLTGSSCDAVTGQEHSQAILEYLENANMFIIPLDNERCWFRYHHLLSDILRERLRQTQPDKLKVLHLRASIWHEENGMDDEAIEHALKAEDFEREAILIEDRIDTLWQSGGHTKLRHWLLEIPQEIIYAKPRLCIYHAMYLFSGAQIKEAMRSIRAVEKILEAGTEINEKKISTGDSAGLTHNQRRILQGRLAAIQAFMGLRSQVDQAKIIRFANEALDKLPENDLSMRNMAAIGLGDAYFQSGEIAESYKAYLNALEVVKSTGNLYFLIVTNLKLAITMREQGRLNQVLELCKQQMELCQNSGLSGEGVIGWLLGIWGEVLAEMNDLDEGLDLVRRAVNLPKPGSDVAMHSWSYLCLLKVLYSRGDLEDANQVIKQTDKFSLDHKVPEFFKSQMAAWQTRIWLAQDNIELASLATEEYGHKIDGEQKIPENIGYFLLSEYVVIARSMIAQGLLNNAIQLLDRLFERAESGGQTSRVIEILLLQAIAYQASGDKSRAMAKLEQALNLAEPAGFIRIFVDEGPPIARLLYEFLNNDGENHYVQKLLSAFPVDEPKQITPVKGRGSINIETLSKREIEILELISDGLTNPEIATELFLTLNTVKVHNRNIYAKLGVHNRTQAVVKSKTLGILPTT